MIKREHLIAGAVFAVAAFFAIYFIGGSIYGAFSAKSKQLTDAQAELDEKKKLQSQVQVATMRLKKYQGRALPVDPKTRDVLKAKSLYQAWLVNLLAKHKFAATSVQPAGEKPLNKENHIISYRLLGEGDLVQVTELLYDFYAVDYLHRIGRITLTPVEQKENERDTNKKKLIKLEMTAEVLAMPGAPQITALPTAEKKPSNRLSYGKVEQYVAAITGRSVFNDPHLPPSIKVDSRSKYELGDTVSFKATGSDPEKTPITFSLQNSKLAGAKIDPKSGSFSWKPDKAGNYEVLVRAADGGMPAKFADQLVKIVVEEKRVPIVDTRPPDPPEPFDASRFTNLSAVITVNGVSQAWFSVRTSGKILVVKVGDTLESGDMKGKVVAIGREDVELQLNDGKRWLVTRGNSMRDGYPLPAIPAAAETKPAEETSAEAPTALEASAAGE
jgi:hypothetical protein